jgi:UDP-GlcNAc3NAcA epimerase
MLIGIEQAILNQKPDAVLVYGDTNSTLAGALAATKLHTPLYHVEAGLRSFNRKMPEEINRILTDHASDLLFAPTENAVQQLRHEGIPHEKIILSGDVMYDAALFYGEQAERGSKILEHLNLQKDSFILATVHRAENTDDPVVLERIMKELGTVAEQYPVIFPIHPRTRAKLAELSVKVRNVTLIDPVGYLDMVQLEKNSKLIITDSGGVQKEAYFHKKPCITLRAETEWVELVETGWNSLHDPKSQLSILRTLETHITTPTRDYKSNIYGDGLAATFILNKLMNIHLQCVKH